MTVHVNGGELPQKEIDLYVERANSLHKGTTSMDINVDGEYVDITYHVLPFYRIRRITGYLVGDMGRWNDAKRAEEHDRVKHSIMD